MPASLAATKRRLDSTRSTRQITQAMQMVSTAKLNQIQHHTLDYENYASRVKQIMVSLVQSHNADATGNSGAKYAQLFTSRPVKKTGVLVITSDRGLVGSYNSNILKSVMSLMDDHHLTKDNAVFLAVGRTGADFLKKRGMNVAFDYEGVNDVPKYREVHGVVKNAVNNYYDGVYDELYLVYSHYVNRIRSDVRTQKILPISEKDLLDQTDHTKTDGKPTKVKPLAQYELDPDPETLVKVLLSQYESSLIYGSIIDAKTSEHASSANAMSSATDNADDIISTLQLRYNRARQAAITTEITEITGGMTAQE